MQKYFNSRGHKAVISLGINPDALAFADITICGWANEIAEYLTTKMPKQGKLICYARSYEMFHGQFEKVRWGHVDKMVFVNQRMIGLPNVQKILQNRQDSAELIYNGIDLDEWKFQCHQPGKKIGFVADLTFKKGVQLLAQVMMALPKEYELYILGNTPDLRLGSYFNHILEQNQIKAYIDAKTDNVKNWLKDKDYIISTSPVEGNPNNVIEAMACGIKPVIHNWAGAREQFPEELVFNTVADAVKIITESRYVSMEYRKWVMQHYDYKLVYKQLEEVCNQLLLDTVKSEKQ